MTQELAKTYNSADFEDRVYQTWLDSGLFNPDRLDLPESAPNYTIILPPPNITDKLHVGHAAMLAIQDLFIRYKRQQGFRTLWLPGTDHAAIATQTVVEKKILKEEGKTRQTLGRPEFLKRVNLFVKETQATILEQTKKMGSSLDWSRLAFTLDEPRKAAVSEMFIRMYQDGLIYRGERVINWCPRCQSTLADDEVEHEEQAAKLYTFKYDANFPIEISTTRPETKLGDTAVAVNPKDVRYKKYIGQEFVVDFCGTTLKLRIIADRNVEMEFGTGALGVTPAHSFVDWQMAQANDLPLVKVVNEDAKIRAGFGEFSGMTTLAAREAIVAELEKRGLMISTEDMQNNLSVCYRCGTAIEPLPSKQWFVAVDKPLARLQNKSLKTLALEAATQHKIEFLPERFVKKYEDWMSNLKDWCISRQIWFGHEIPVWYKKNEKPASPAGRLKIKNEKLGSSSDDEVEEIYVGKAAPEGEGWIHDTDTLDTWFSSGMWTFSTMSESDLKKFQPTQMMETGYELITLWISRMVMMSYYALGEIPFAKVYLHGMVLDKQGKKMSKSKGNGIDPSDMIKLYGADATRLSLLIGNTPGNDTRFSEDKVAMARNFVNKLWNMARFILDQTAEVKDPASAKATVGEVDENNLTMSDAWILSRWQTVKNTVTTLLDEYEFGAAGELLKDFTINEVADWYLEATKFQKNAGTPAVLKKLLQELLIVWQSFMPFITQVLWQALGETKLLLVEPWPEKVKSSKFKVKSQKHGDDFEVIKEIVVAIRQIRSENKIAPAIKLEAVIYAGDKVELLESQKVLLMSLRTNLKSIEIKKSGAKIDNSIFAAAAGCEIYLLLPSSLEASASQVLIQEKETARLRKEKINLEKIIAQLAAKLDNEEFINNAPEKIVAIEKEKLMKWQEELNKINQRLK